MNIRDTVSKFTKNTAATAGFITSMFLSPLQPAHAQEKPAADKTPSSPFSLTVDYSLNSKYFAPIGYALTPNNAASQGLLAANLNNVLTSGDALDASVWANAGHGGPNEVDYSIGYTLPLGPNTSLRSAFTAFTYPDGVLANESDKLIQLTANHAGTLADLSINGFWLLNNFKAEFNISPTISKTVDLYENKDLSITASPSVSGYYNKDIYGLEGIAGMSTDLNLALQKGNATLYLNAGQFFKNGEGSLGTQPLSNETVLKIGASYTFD